MTSDPSLLFRVTRLENEAESIYEMLTDIKATQAAHTVHLSQHDARFDRVDARFDQHDARFDQHDAEFARVHATLEEVLRRLPQQH